MPSDPFDRLLGDVEQLRKELQQQGILNARLDQRLQAVERDIEQIASVGDARYVPLIRYVPVERVVFGVVGLILMSTITAVLALVLR